MKEKNLYYPLWQRYLPVIVIQVKNAINGAKQIKMSKAEFEVYGNRLASAYSINLEIENGKVVNNISGSAVARDLYDILKMDNTCKTLFTEHNYKFSMGKDFILNISIV
jgi:hypothetical protein